MSASLLLLLFLSWVHPFYVSITSIDYAEDRNMLEVSSRIFYDDLEAALNQDGNQKIDLIRPTNRTVADSAIARYLRKNLKISINGAPAPLHYLGYEIEEDVAWCFLEAKSTADGISKLGIECSTLYQLFDTQSNIFHVSVKKLRKSLKLDYPKKSNSVTFP